MKFASVYARKGRPVWYVSYLCAESGIRKHEATAFRLDDLIGRKKAYDYAMQRAKEVQNAPDNRSEHWGQWVVPFIEKRYKGRELTLKTYRNSWRWIATFFDERKIAGPRSLTAQHCYDYHEWRQAYQKREGKSASHNTALNDLTILKVICRDASRRFGIPNVMRDVSIVRKRSKEKLEITDADMQIIIAALDQQAREDPSKKWMREAWEIARWQGCRFAETSIDFRRQINLVDGILTLFGKGRDGEAKVVQTLLHPNLKPLFEGMIAEGREVTFTIDHKRTLHFLHFFRRIGFGRYSFHCTRVTVITKLIRAGASEAQVMAYIGHGSKEVSRIYQKLKPRDLVQMVSALRYGGS